MIIWCLVATPMGLVIGVTSLWLALRASKGKRASEEQECGRTLWQLHN